MKVTKTGDISSPADLGCPRSNEMKYGKSVYKFGVETNEYTHTKNIFNREMY